MNLKLSIVTSISLFAVSIGNATSPYAPERIGIEPDGSEVSAYSYDNAGARLSDAVVAQMITYGLNGKPEEIKTDGALESLRYGPGGSRYLRKDANGNKTFYVGGVEYQMPAEGEATSVVLIRNGSYSPVAQAEKTSASTQYLYHLRDHQGSPLTTVDEAGAIISEQLHDVWGMATDYDGTVATLIDTSRGYAGHENLPSAGLTHANGRVYDPRIKQFISPDPVLFGGNLISHNRYAYGMHSPSNYTDVTGYMMRRDGRGGGRGNSSGGSAGRSGIDSQRQLQLQQLAQQQDQLRLQELDIRLNRVRLQLHQVTQQRRALIEQGRARNDVLARGPSNEPIFAPTGPPQAMNPRRAGHATLQEGVLFTQDLRFIPAQRNLSNNMAWDCDCHGYTVADGRYWINDPDMQVYLQNSTLMRQLRNTESPQVGDWVVYRNTAGDVVHSAILSAPSEVTMAAGTVIYPGHIEPSKLTTVPVDEGWRGASVEYWRKREGT